MRQFQANSNDAGVRLSRFVLRVTHDMPTSLLYKALRNKRIKVNGKKATADYRLVEGDRVEMYINDEFFADASQHIPLEGCKQNTPAPFETAWQDDALAVLFKPAGVLSHSDKKGVPNLLDSFTQSLIDTHAYDPAAANGFAPALCNRLDRGTEGLVLAAKSYAALRDINALIAADMLIKQYLCVTLGAPREGRHDAYHRRDMDARTVSIHKGPAPGTKPIATGIEVLEKHGPLCLCRITLYTGRTHQIRAHLAHLGTPIVGDRKYGGQKDSFGLTTQALCAYSLVFKEDLPKDNTMAYLNGRSFTAQSCTLQSWWQRYKEAP